ncbi:EamA family transporter, partial [Azospirillum brasilense]|uniref:DMT family transporter n=1 Tax=Azospirillum argentinense TaxID=2970906 RepID=UPI00190EEE93
MTLPSATVPPASRGAESLALLLLVGGLIGVIFPVTKIAQAAGVPPLPWAFSMMLGAGVILAGMARVKRQPMPLTGRYLRYFAVSGLLSMALPNVVLFFVMPWLGAGLSAVVYTLPPILTLLMAVAVRIGKPHPRPGAGIPPGFVRALLIVRARGSLPPPRLAGWVAAAFLLPGPG